MQFRIQGEGLTKDVLQNAQKPPFLRGVGGINPDFFKTSNRLNQGNIPDQQTLNGSRVEGCGDWCCIESWGIAS